jgi:DnaJ-class molecular chaperone
MPMTTRYDDDFDERGVLRDGKRVRVSMQMRDAAMLCHVNTRSRITDGTGNPFGLNKPGFRVRTGDMGKSRVADAYAQYERSLVTAYLGDTENQCTHCFGSGLINGEDCEDCDGTGIAPDERSTRSSKGGKGGGYGSGNEGGYKGGSSDGRSLDQKMRDHKERTARLIALRDAEDANAWRNG